METQMIPLHQMQKRFVASLALNITDPVLFSLFNSSQINRASIHQRFEVYRHNGEENLFKALKNIYPVSCCLVGEACFRALSLLFIRESISKHFSLNTFGEDFFHFLAKYATEWALPYLPDIASLEWKIHLTFLGPENSMFSYQRLLSIPEEQQPQVVFKLAENGQLFFSTFPVDKIWAAHQIAWDKSKSNEKEQGDLPACSSELDAFEVLELEPSNTQLFIYRPEARDYSIHLASLTPLEWQLLKGIDAGKTLGELYKNFTAAEEQEAIMALASCVHKGYITNAYINLDSLED